MRTSTFKPAAQLVVVLLCALTVKLYYSTASPNQLRWILAPTTVLVELVSGIPFEFESHAGYLSSDRSFLIGVSCAGVNFLITAFLMLALGRLWRDRSQDIAWSFMPVAALCAFLATLAANSVRISTALHLRRVSRDISWLSPDQLHRFEGIFIYFGFLLLLFMVSEKMGSENSEGISSHAAGPRWSPTLFRQSFFPLLIYYATMLGIPLANGAYHQGVDFWEHAIFVLLTPLLLILPLAAFRLVRDRRLIVGVALRGHPSSRFYSIHRNMTPRKHGVAPEGHPYNEPNALNGALTLVPDPHNM